MLNIKNIGTGISIYNGFLNISYYNQIIEMFIYFIGSLILISLLPNKIKLNDNERPENISSLVIQADWLFNYPLIILFNLLGASCLITSSDLLFLYISIELQSFSLYILSSLNKNSISATGAGLKYFLIGGLASCFILLGIGLIYSSTGLTQFDSLTMLAFPNDNSFNLNLIFSQSNFNLWLESGIIFIVAGLLIKLGSAPFHQWAPDWGLRKSSPIGNKLSNSGDILKLIIPSYNRKVVSGQNNYLGKVTSYKITERAMDYRGSKSGFFINLLYNLFNLKPVKEQRVYGSYSGIPGLRCTLMGFERNYQVKIPSNLIIHRRLYSKLPDLVNTVNRKLTQLIEPWFISGFSDAEGCFLIIVRKSQKNKISWHLEANFTINLHSRDLNLLKLIQAYFEGAGRISKERNGCCDFTIGSLDQILNKVLPHFDKYPLKTQKYADYILFKKAVILMSRGEHLTYEGLQKIINIRATLNKGLTLVLKEAFPNTVGVLRPSLPESALTLHPQWVSGFVSGDGSFTVSIRESKVNKAGSHVVIIFIITQHNRDELLLKSLVKIFECGHIYFYKDYIEFRCQSFKDNYEKILPFFTKYPILGVKSQDFKDWAKVAEMMKTKGHLTKEGLDLIRQIRAGMNKGRY